MENKMGRFISKICKKKNPKFYLAKLPSCDHFMQSLKIRQGKVHFMVTGIGYTVFIIKDSAKE
jgi:hypothetical protein